MTLKRLWSNYDLALDYIGGVGYYNHEGQGFKSLQQMDLDQKITWKRGQLSLRDSFSYLPEGNFGGAYGSMGSQGIASLGNTAFGSFWGGSSLGTLGLAPRILNVSSGGCLRKPHAQVERSRRQADMPSRISTGTTPTGTAFIGSSQVSAQVGYNRILTPHTQIALVYGYQGFDFSVAGNGISFPHHPGMYGHRISGRMDLLLGAGPQIHVHRYASCGLQRSNVATFYCQVFGDTLIPLLRRTPSIGVAAQARLRYKFTKTSLDLDLSTIRDQRVGIVCGGAERHRAP